MAEVPIDTVSLDAEGRLLVRPVLSPDADYAFIYRAAVGVDWDPESRSLVAPVPKEWSYLDWFLNICAAVRSEYGDQLVLPPETEWYSVPEELQRQIRESMITPAV